MYTVKYSNYTDNWVYTYDTEDEARNEVMFLMSLLSSCKRYWISLIDDKTNKTLIKINVIGEV